MLMMIFGITFFAFLITRLVLPGIQFGHKRSQRICLGIDLLARHLSVYTELVDGIISVTDLHQAVKSLRN